MGKATPEESLLDSVGFAHIVKTKELVKYYEEVVTASVFCCITVAQEIKCLKCYREVSEQAWNRSGSRITYLRYDNVKELMNEQFPDDTPELNRAQKKRRHSDEDYAL